jgi:hypothetical protein
MLGCLTVVMVLGLALSTVSRSAVVAETVLRRNTPASSILSCR